MLIYVKRRLAMCARKLDRLKEASKIFRDVSINQCKSISISLCVISLMVFNFSANERGPTNNECFKRPRKFN